MAKPSPLSWNVRPSGSDGLPPLELVALSVVVPGMPPVVEIVKLLATPTVKLP